MVDHYWNAHDNAWKHRDNNSDVPAELAEPVGSGTSPDDWKEYGFVVVRKLPFNPAFDSTVRFKIVLKDSHLIRICRDIIGEIQDLSWNSEPLEVSRAASQLRSLAHQFLP